MNLTTHLAQAIQNLLAAKLRSFLAVLGILVGSASVVALVISGELATQQALSQFKSLGTNLLAVSLYEKKTAPTSSLTQRLSVKDWEKSKQALPGVVEIAPYINLYNPLSYQGHKINGSIIGADASLASVINIQMESGRFVSFFDKYNKHCIIGEKIAAQIQKFSKHPALGQQIWLGDSIYTVIGVIKPWEENAFFNNDINKSVIIPIRGAGLISAQAKINNVIFKLAEQADIDTLISGIRAFVKRHAPTLSLFPRSAKQMIKSMQAQGHIFTLLLGLIGGISLLVGGIGVMNVMLVSVVERRREIGIRKAVGAKRADIQKLFLIEAIVLALFGGVLGVATGLLVAYIISVFSNWPFAFFWSPPLIGFAVSVATGVFFGFYPALRAARLSPIETLRS